MTLWRTATFASMAMLGCSTVEQAPAPVECEDDSDCLNPGERCSVGRVCVPGDQLPPLAHLGFDISERDALGQVLHRTEVAGCDVELENVATEDPGTIVVPRSAYVQRLEVAICEDRGGEVREATHCDAPTDEALRGELLLPAQLLFRHPSRFNRQLAVGSSFQISREHPAGEADRDPVAIDWPRYHPLDELSFDAEFALMRYDPASPCDGSTVPGPAIYEPLRTPPSPFATCRTVEDCCEDPETNCPWTCDPALLECRPSGPPTFSYHTWFHRPCERPINADVVYASPTAATEEPPVFSPVQGGTINLRHHDVPDEPRQALALGEAVRCDRDADCPSDEQICVDDRCALGLAGRVAIATATAPDSGGTFSAQTYLYPEIDGCERRGTRLVVGKTYLASVTPPEETARVLPSMAFELPVEFPPNNATGQQGPGTVVGLRDLCLVDLGPPRTLEVALRGEPVELISDGQTYTCCDLGCLPSDDDTPPTSMEPPSSCTGDGASGTAQIRVESLVETTDALETLWSGEDAPCLPPIASGNAIGRLDRQGIHQGAGLWHVPQIALHPDEPRSYTFRIETPVGALHRSTIFDLPLQEPETDDDTPRIEVELQSRHLVRGFVTVPPELCQSNTPDCGTDTGVVLAERLRMPGETSENTPGPYFHQIDTFYDPNSNRHGAYVLPLDPGVWVLTALPAAGSAGGPAPFRVVDLRNARNMRIDFELELGILVTLDLSSFARTTQSARNTQVVPLDRGSWRQGSDRPLHPDRVDAPDPQMRLLDLNAPDECLAAPEVGAQGCEIRRLIPRVTLPLSQVGTVRFSARSSSGGAVCTSSN